MAKKKLNHHLYQDPKSEVWYFQKKVRGAPKPYKFSLETTSITTAREKRDEYLKQIEYHGYIPTLEREIPSVDNQGKVFGEVAVEWASIKRSRVSETTYHAYQKAMNTHVLKHFGNVPINQITSLEIEKFLSNLKCTPKTKINIYTPFKGVMKFAKKHKIIQYDPTIDVDPIGEDSSKKNEHPPLSLNEIQQFLEHLDDFWKPLFIFMFFTGVRIGEASALKWKRVDLKKGIAKIHRSLVYIEGKKVYKSTKTDGSHRDIMFFPPVNDALLEQKKRTFKGSLEDFVFLNRKGANIHRHTLNRTVIKPTLVKAGLGENRSIKDTRASYITNCLDNGERMSFVQRQVGHVNTKMIIEHYYRNVSAPDDGSRLAEAWHSTSIPPEVESG